MYTDSLCHSCLHVRTIENKRGSVFYLCQKAAEDPRYMKYPPQPVRRCLGYVRATEGKDGNQFA